jgi:hypothetical protein
LRLTRDKRCRRHPWTIFLDSARLSLLLRRPPGRRGHTAQPAQFQRGPSLCLARRCAPTKRAPRRWRRSGALCAGGRGAPGSVLKAQPVPTRGPAAVMPHQEIAIRHVPNEPERCTQQLVRSTLPNSPRTADLHESPTTWQPNEPEPTPAKLFERLPRAAHGHANEPVSRDRGRGCGQLARAHGRSRPWRSRGPGTASIELGARLSSRDRRRRTRGRRTGRSCSRPPLCARA